MCLSRWLTKFYPTLADARVPDSGLAKAPLQWHKTNNAQLPGWLQPIYLQDMLGRIEIREKQKETERMHVRKHLVLQTEREGGRLYVRREREQSCKERSKQT
ncbi:hypothetical protein Q8A73_011521 [Channa argus]|nr:hypothetical protein Q8A73_011521 [Channa argus]